MNRSYREPSNRRRRERGALLPLIIIINYHFCDAKNCRINEKTGLKISKDSDAI